MADKKQKRIALVEFIVVSLIVVGLFFLTESLFDLVTLHERIEEIYGTHVPYKALDILFLLVLLLIWFAIFSWRIVSRERRLRKEVEELRDVLDKKTLQKEVEKSLHRLKLVQDVARMGFIYWDLVTGKAECSDSVYEMYGLSKKEKELDIDEIVSLVHPDDSEMVRKRLDRAIAGKEEYDIDHRMVRKSDGRVIWVYARAEIKKDAEGKPATFWGTVVDITDRKRLEEEVRDKYRNIRQLFDVVPEALFTLHFENGKLPVFVDVNAGALKMFRASSEKDWVNKSPVDISPSLQPDGTESVKRIMDASRRVVSGEEMDFEWVHRRFDGTDFSTDTSLRPYDIEGERRILVTVRDVSARKEAQKRLEESEYRTRTITETAQDAIILLDNEGRVQYWNPSAERIFGYNKDEILSQDMVNFIMPGEYKSMHLSKFAEFQKTGEGNALGKTVELRGKKKNGAEFPIELSLSSIKTSNGYQAVGIIRDISERKKVKKEMLDKNMELQKAIKMMVDREKRMIELKRELKSLKRKKKNKDT